MQDANREERLELLANQKQGGSIFKKTSEKYQIDKNTTRIVYIGKRNVKHVKYHGEYVTISSLKKKLNIKNK